MVRFLGEKSVEINPQTVTVVGWHGFLNLGDDAMLLVMGRLISARFGAARVRILTSSNKMPSIRVPGILWVPFFPNWLDSVPRGEELLRLLSVWGSETLIFGGGSILSTTRSIRWKYRLAQIHRYLHPSGRRGLLGVSIGPFEDKVGEDYAIRLLRFCDFAVVRDSRSFEWAKAVSANQPLGVQILLSPDLTFALRKEVNVPSGGVPNKSIVVALRGDILATDLRKVFLRNLAKALLELIDSGRAKHVKIMAFQVGGQSLDLLVARDLENRVGRRDNVRVIAYDGDPLRALQEVSSCELVIGMRLHAKIFSTFTGNKLVNIFYHQKDHDFVQDWKSGKAVTLEVSGSDSQSAKEILSGRLGSPPDPTNVAFDFQKISEML